jgi:hypothetical protein
VFVFLVLVGGRGLSVSYDEFVSVELKSSVRTTVLFLSLVIIQISKLAISNFYKKVNEWYQKITNY